MVLRVGEIIDKLVGVLRPEELWVGVLRPDNPGIGDAQLLSTSVNRSATVEFERAVGVDDLNALLLFAAAIGDNVVCRRTSFDFFSASFTGDDAKKR